MILNLFYGVVRWMAKKDPNKPAVITPYEITTYGQLSELIAYEVEKAPRYNPKGRVINEEEQEPQELIAGVIGGLVAGQRVFPVPPSLHQDHKKAMFTALATTTEPVPQFGDLIHITSGTSGIQKLVIRPMDNLESEASGLAANLQLTTKSNVLLTSPLAHSFGCGIWRATIIAGATLYVATGGQILDRVGHVREVIRNSPIDFMFGVPYMYRLLTRSVHKLEPKNPSLRAFAGGEVLPGDVVRQWKVITGLDLKQEYGLGEGGITTIAAETSHWSSLGQPLLGVTLEMRDEENGVGELVVHRAGPPKKYLFGESPETFQPDGGIRTGDLVRLRNDGEYEFVGRKKSVIVVAGLKMVPHELEDIIRQRPGVLDTAVVGVHDDLTGERPVAFVVPDASSRVLSATKLHEFLRDNLDSYKVPKRIRILPYLPRTASGKVDRNALIAMEQEKLSGHV